MIMARYGNVDAQHYTYTLTEEGSRKWGAYLPPGSDTERAANFRASLRAELTREAARIGGVIEVFALGAPIEAPDWQVGKVGPC